MDVVNGHFEKLVTELKAAWRGEQFGAQRDAVWAVFKDKVPRRLRTCDSIVDLVDILVDRGSIAPWDTRLLLRLSDLFPGIRRASGLVNAYNKVTAHRGNACTMCQGGQFEETPTTLALPSKSRRNQERAELLSAILYLCRRFGGGHSWRDLVRRFPVPLHVREVDINDIEVMPCATDPGRKNCPECSSYEALYPWSQRHSRRVNAAFLRECLKKDLGLRTYVSDLDQQYHLSEEVQSKCLLVKADFYSRDTLPEGSVSVPIEDLVGHIMDKEENKVPSR